MEALLREKFVALTPIMNERARRLWVASEVKAIGRGGQLLVARLTGMSSSTIYFGLQEIAASDQNTFLVDGRIRCPGGGRKSLIYHQPTLLTAIEAIVEPTSRGEPPVAVALELQKCSEAGNRIESTGISDRAAKGGRLAQGTRL